MWLSSYAGEDDQVTDLTHRFICRFIDILILWQAFNFYRVGRYFWAAVFVYVALRIKWSWESGE